MNNPFAEIKQQLAAKGKTLVHPFSEENIQKLFGHEAAEDEVAERLKEYYFKNDTYEQVAADLKLRILVGHKGIGKSALFKVASAEAEENGILPIHIQPNDIVDISDADDFLGAIRNWREGLLRIIAEKIFESFTGSIPDNFTRFKIPAAKLVASALEALEALPTGKIGKRIVYNNFLKNKRVDVYIDDLDRGWHGTTRDINRISALLNAVRDISNDSTNVHFKVALRSDVYFLVRTSDESTDKIEGSVVWYSWTNNEILALLAKRVETFFKRTVSETELISLHQEKIAQYLKPVMTLTFDGIGKWHNAPIYRILTSLIRKRPRDLVKLCTLAARNAKKRNKVKIETTDFQSVFETYSLERIQDTINEFRSELPEINRLLFLFKPSVKKSKKFADSYVFETTAILTKIRNSIGQTPYYFTCDPNKPATEHELLHFLYKINFLTGRRKNKNEITVRKYFEENKYITSRYADFGFSWEVHPAYRWALEPDDIDVIYQKLDLLDSE